MAEYLEYDWKSNMISQEVLRSEMKTKETLDKPQCVRLLRTLIENCDIYHELKNNVPLDDDNLAKFLYARKFNVPDAFLLVKNYYWYRRKNQAIFTDFTLAASDIRLALENGLPGVLDSKDRKGRCVVILNAANWDCSYSLLSVYRAILYTLEVLANDVHNQANGFVVIVDWTAFSFRQTSNLKPGILKLMIEGLQDCFPARFKGVHFLGQPWYVEAALTVIKPFLKDKTRERIYVHGNNLSTLHDYVARDILPTEMGGERASYNPEAWLKSLMDGKALVV